MPAISFFADADDAPRLVEHLNEDPEIAFFVPLDSSELLPAYQAVPGNVRIEQQRWKAVHRVESLRDGQYSLWHVPAGELLLPVPSGKLIPPPGVPIADPWSGWCGRSILVSTAADRVVIPDVHAGPGENGIIRFDLWTRHRAYSEEERATNKVFASWWIEHPEFLAASSFQWVGGRYKPAPKETVRWWNRLKRWMGRTCAKLTDPSGQQAFYAFPSALVRLKAGIKYYSYNWNLDASIRGARLP